MTADEALAAKQRAFAREQARTAKDLDALHRRLHPELHTGPAATNRKGPNR